VCKGQHVGYVNAVDAKSAIVGAIKKYDIQNPETQANLVASPVFMPPSSSESP
jgi:hypothetical protein